MSIKVTCSCEVRQLFIHEKTNSPKHMLWVLKKTFSMRQFFLARKTYANNYGCEIINNFTLKIFVYLNMCLCNIFQTYLFQ